MNIADFDDGNRLGPGTEEGSAVKEIFRKLIVTFGLLALIHAPVQQAFAEADVVPKDGGGWGCIVREPGSARFLRSVPDKADVAKTAADAYRLRGARFVDPCLTGQIRNLPAAVYGALAEKHPEIFQPLEGHEPNVGLPAQGDQDHIPAGVAQYGYVGLDEPAPPVPSGFWFFDPFAITNDGVVYGTAFTLLNEEVGVHVASVKSRVVTLEHQGYAITANEAGMAGGFIVIDPVNFFRQAALFDGGQVRLIPRLPNRVLKNAASPSVSSSLEENRT